MDQESLTTQNRIAWESNAYKAWVAAYGTPMLAAQKLVENPARKLKRILPHIDDFNGLTIANPLGSHGRVAVSMALLGADVTVFDLSSSNQRYANELARAANVEIAYLLGDFLQIALQHAHRFDCVVMELGVLHYFVDLKLFVQTVRSLLVTNGVLILHEFHPLLRKAINATESEIELKGDYFYTGIESSNTPFEIFLKQADVPKCTLRKWNLGEIVTAFIENGFVLNKLIEEPSNEQPQLPGMFSLVATAV